MSTNEGCLRAGLQRAKKNHTADLRACTRIRGTAKEVEECVVFSHKLERN